MLRVMAMMWLQNVQSFKVGARVAFLSQGAKGSYAELCAVPADKVLPVPDGLDLKLAAASLLQGLTAHYLTHSTYPIKAGDTVLVHAGMVVIDSSHTSCYLVITR